MSKSNWANKTYIIKCCHKCVAPKRHPGCHDTCQEYKNEKAKFEAIKEAEKKEKEKHPVLTKYDFRM